MATATELKDKLTARLEQIEKFKTFKPDKALKEIKDTDEEIKEKQEENAKRKADLAAFYAFLGEPNPDDTSAIPFEELKTKITGALARIPNGSDGKKLATAIGDFRITSETISDFYWKDDQTFLKKGKNAKGEVEVGAKTRYMLATSSDKDEIEASKKAEEAKQAAIKAKRQAKNK